MVKRSKGKGAYSSLWIGHPSQSYGASPAIWDHTVLPVVRHRWTRPALTPAMQAGTPFTYPGGIEGWVDLGVGYIPRWFTCPQTVTHPGTNHLIATAAGVEPTTSRSQVQRPNRYTTKSPIVKRSDDPWDRTITCHVYTLQQQCCYLNWWVILIRLWRCPLRSLLKWTISTGQVRQR